MRTAVSENGFAVNCRFNGFLFTLETVYHREQELMTESYDLQTGMLKVEVEICSLFSILTSFRTLQHQKRKNLEPKFVQNWL